MIKKYWSIFSLDPGNAEKNFVVIGGTIVFYNTIKIMGEQFDSAKEVIGGWLPYEEELFIE
jgi:hypothetical protein